MLTVGLFVAVSVLAVVLQGMLNFKLIKLHAKDVVDLKLAELKGVYDLRLYAIEADVANSMVGIFVSMKAYEYAAMWALKSANSYAKAEDPSSTNHMLSQVGPLLSLCEDIKVLVNDPEGMSLVAEMNDTIGFLEQRNDVNAAHVKEIRALIDKKWNATIKS